MLSTGTVLQGRYRISGDVGRGGMAVVYVAEDLQLSGALVAIKRLTQTTQDTSEKEAYVRQFKNEAQVLRSLHHPHVPRVYGCFEEHGEHYLVMDFVNGQTLDTLVDLSGVTPPRFRPSVEDVLAWSRQMLMTLAYLHEQAPFPVVYKDLKPDNIMLTSNGIMFLDFGIAKSSEPDGRYSTVIKGIGTPGFAAPEQYHRGATDPRSDLYSLGATLYTLLGGRVPADSLSRQEAIVDGSRDPVVPLHQLHEGVTTGLETLVHRLMAVRRGDRYQSAREALCDLDQLIHIAPSSHFNTIGQQVHESNLPPTQVAPLPSSQSQASQITRQLAAPPQVRLYDSNDVGIATVTGGLLGGSLVLSANYWKLGYKYASAWTIVFGGVLTCIFCLAAFSGASKTTGSWIGFVIACPFLMQWWARKLQGVAVDRHKATGGLTGASWKAAGVGCLGLILPLLLLAVLSSVFSEPYGKRFQVSASEDI